MSLKFAINLILMKYRTEYSIAIKRNDITTVKWHILIWLQNEWLSIMLNSSVFFLFDAAAMNANKPSSRIFVIIRELIVKMFPYKCITST